MFYVILNDGRKVNLLFTSKIYVQDTDVIYETSVSSLNVIKEHFNTQEDATNRYNNLKELYA